MTQAMAAVLLRQVDAEEPERGIAFHHLARDRLVLLLHFARERRKLGPREASRRVAELFLLLRESEVHSSNPP